MTDKKLYVVKEGYSFGASDEYKAGDTVELTEAEAKGFLDKLRLSERAEAPTLPQPDPEPGKARGKGKKAAALPSE